ncbi:MAG: Ig-like domain-containing protein [Myxococcales bacterium]|jgi:hypothetical protein
MRRVTLIAALALAAAACQKPEYLDMQPKEHVFKGIGDELWWKAIPKSRQGKSFQKQQSEVRWATSNSKVAIVDEVGKVHSVGPGQATITATLGELKAEARVEVVTVAKVTVTPTELSLEARGEPQPLTITVYDYLGRELKDRMPLVRCENEDVCRISNLGVHPVDPGETVVAISAEGQRAEVKVTVVPAKGKKE